MLAVAAGESLDEPAPTEADPVAGLVAAAARGDRGAFAALHRRFCRVVHAVLLARVPAQDADDLVQDVFLRAFEQLDALRDGERFGPWLLQVARNRAIDHNRSRRTLVALPDDLVAAGRWDLEAREALEAIRSLPEAYRETLIMRLCEGLTGPEIALKTGLAPGSVRVNLHRGMALLRERLGGGE